jgi:hypothetical protein
MTAFVHARRWGRKNGAHFIAPRFLLLSTSARYLIDAITLDDVALVPGIVAGLQPRAPIMSAAALVIVSTSCGLMLFFDRRLRKTVIF